MLLSGIPIISIRSRFSNYGWFYMVLSYLAPIYGVHFVALYISRVPILQCHIPIKHPKQICWLDVLHHSIHIFNEWVQRKGETGNHRIFP